MRCAYDGAANIFTQGASWPQNTDGDPIVVNGHQTKTRVPVTPLTVTMPSISLPNLRLASAAGPAPYNPKQHYCGADGGQAFPDGSWGGACYSHDNCYGTMGADKGQCDLHLMQDIMTECSGSGTPSPICAVIASWYYLGVTFGGTGPFNRAQGGGR